MNGTSDIVRLYPPKPTPSPAPERPTALIGMLKEAVQTFQRAFGVAEVVDIVQFHCDCIRRCNPSAELLALAELYVFLAQCCDRMTSEEVSRPVLLEVVLTVFDNVRAGNDALKAAAKQRSMEMDMEYKPPEVPVMTDEELDMYLQ